MKMRQLTASNVNKSRRILEGVNCMGYALDIADWMDVPVEELDDISRVMADFGYEPCLPNDIIKGKYEGIVFRHSGWGFHFVYISIDGEITHKPGELPVMPCSPEYLFDPIGWKEIYGDRYQYRSALQFYRREVRI